MIILIICLLFVLYLCSIWESSFSSLNIIRIKKMAMMNNKRAKVVYDLSLDYSKTITTILIINCVCSVFVSSITAFYFSNLYGDKYVGLVTAILTIVI